MIAALVVAATLWLQAPAPPVATPSATATIDETAPVGVPDPGEKALQYYRSGNVLWVVDQVFGIAVLVAILITGFSARLRNAAQRIGRRWLVTLAIYFVLFTLVSFV